VRRVRRSINDFDGFAAAFPQWDGGFTQMSRGSFQGDLQIAVGPQLRAFDVATNQSIHTKGGGAETVTFIPIDALNEGTLWQGRRLARGALLMRGAHVGYDNRTEPGARIRALIVPVATMAKAASALSGGTLDEDWTTWRGLLPEPRALARFEACLEALLCGTDGMMHTAEAEARCLRALVDAVLSAGGETAAPRQHDRARLVEHVIRFLRDRLSASVTASDLCSAFGVSDRLLRLAFKEAYGVGPLTYFKLLRLHAVRQALIAARGRDTSVAEILERNGVTRPAAFAGVYRRHFGERPSETLGVRGWDGVQAMTRAAFRPALPILPPSRYLNS
jgi:AraC family ethanolamine operon transcriptional activator